MKFIYAAAVAVPALIVFALATSTPADLPYLSAKYKHGQEIRLKGFYSTCKGKIVGISDFRTPKKEIQYEVYLNCTGSYQKAFVSESSIVVLTPGE